jgi:hypothetical protein
MDIFSFFANSTAVIPNSRTPRYQKRLRAFKIIGYLLPASQPIREISKRFTAAIFARNGFK